MNYWPLLGIAVVVAGFALRLNPMLVVVTAGFASGFAAGLGLPELLALIGKAFISARAPLLIVLTLPVIGLLEHAGLREHAQRWIARMAYMSLSLLLICYMGLRQALGALGLTSIGGPAQTVRPLIAPMAEAAARKTQPDLANAQRERIRALAAATDNVGLFFGEDIFIAFGAVLLIQGFYASNGIVLEPLSIALWAIPTALAAFLIHAIRIVVFQYGLKRPETGP
ncbi:DUF969 domain-containing protein [Tahibacter harae]|uniref:DUF969 domain-containing protein n=1 Tax=Tahibacter harae TaxID=2963937 RepID=A0ABT1QRQ9_9GAMM|nr:DUF969 domain-containing protein [Tahibacter harae]MCQ4164965.1 DUF969 domain-containing protein [Tahibacter harae]